MKTSTTTTLLLCCLYCCVPALAGAQTFAPLPDSALRVICAEAGVSPNFAGDTVFPYPRRAEPRVGTDYQFRAIRCAANTRADVTRNSRTRWTVSDTSVATIGRTTGLLKVRAAGSYWVRPCYPATYYFNRYVCEWELPELPEPFATQPRTVRKSP